MPLVFKKANSARYKKSESNTVYLSENNWDDFSFKTTFHATIFDGSKNEYNLGQVKIGYVNQTEGWTTEALPAVFSELGTGYFSLGQSADYYSELRNIPYELRCEFLKGIKDVVFDSENLLLAKTERVFRDSLLRGVNYSTISEQFRRVLEGGAPLTEFHFGYDSPKGEKKAPFFVNFDVVPNAKPSTNIHVLIGRNGTGKTTLLNGMIASLIGERPQPEGGGQFIDTSSETRKLISSKYFSGVVSVSFSAFDPFTPPIDQEGDVEELRYSYIGLKNVYEGEDGTDSEHKDMRGLTDDFVASLITCLGIEVKRERWETAIKYLESDLNFSEMDLRRLLQIKDVETLRNRAKNIFLKKMSSGHAIVLLTITKLVERADEKTLVLMDEPESHLHPPLLSAFTRALADLLNKINGIAIIATHSPVVLQEVPKNCVWKIFRTKLIGSAERPEMETFAENVGILTREVFSLEVTTSGFHELLSKSVSEGKDYDEILLEYKGQVGFEGKAILRGLISNRERLRGNNT
jgi:predicted ATPase